MSDNSEHSGSSAGRALEQNVHDIATPDDIDVLSGRGNFVNYHPGNLRFRELVQKHKIAYVACPKAKKSGFAELIVSELRGLGARFLARNDKTQLWHDIGATKALIKTRQALREGAPDIAERITEVKVDVAGSEAQLPDTGTHKLSSNKGIKRKGETSSPVLSPKSKKAKSLSEGSERGAQALNVLGDSAVISAAGAFPNSATYPLGASLYPLAPQTGALPLGLPLGYGTAPAPQLGTSAASLLLRHADPRLVAAEARLAYAESRLAAINAAAGLNGLYPYAPSMISPVVGAQQQHALSLLQAAVAGQPGYSQPQANSSSSSPLAPASVK